MRDRWPAAHDSPVSFLEFVLGCCGRDTQLVIELRLLDHFDGGRCCGYLLDAHATFMRESWPAKNLRILAPFAARDVRRPRQFALNRA